MKNKKKPKAAAAAPSAKGPGSVMAKGNKK